ncbi:MAG: hypothetical protein V9H26_19710 [Verrucomicrobiota bacterium]
MNLAVENIHRHLAGVQAGAFRPACVLRPLHAERQGLLRLSTTWRRSWKDSACPNAEIAFIQDYDSDASKLTLFRDVRAGKVRVLFGSTQKMGSGTNVQERLIALHHLGRAVATGRRGAARGAHSPAGKQEFRRAGFPLRHRGQL